MRDEKDREAEIPREGVSTSPGPVTPLKAPHDTPPVEVTYRILKNCGDCEPGGFGSTYGFSPR